MQILIFSSRNIFLLSFLFCSTWLENLFKSFFKPGGLDWSRRDLNRDLDLDAQKVSASTVEKISTVFKS